MKCTLENVPCFSCLVAKKLTLYCQRFHFSSNRQDLHIRKQFSMKIHFIFIVLFLMQFKTVSRVCSTQTANSSYFFIIERLANEEVSKQTSSAVSDSENQRNFELKVFRNDILNNDPNTDSTNRTHIEEDEQIYKNQKPLDKSSNKNHLTNLSEYNLLTNTRINVDSLQVATTATTTSTSIINKESDKSLIDSNRSERDNILNVCNSCQSRQRAKIYSLESIKNNILLRLNLEQPPIVKTPFHVPESVLERFYRSEKEEQTDKFHVDESEESYLYGSSYKKDSIYHSVPDIQNDQHIHKRYASLEDVDDDDDEDDEDDEMIRTATHHDSNIFLAEGFHALTNTVFLFPQRSRTRHKHFDVLSFQLDEKYSSVTQAVLHFYVRGLQWIKEYNSSMLQYRFENGTLHRDSYIHISIYRLANSNHLQLLYETHHKISGGQGVWLNADLDATSKFWEDNPGSVQNIVISCDDKIMQTIITNSDQTLMPHFEVKIKEKNRPKRSIAFDCKETDNEDRCCRYPLKVNFTNFGWNFVIAPTSFDAYFCNGECKIGFNPQHTHTYVASLALSASPCCSPTKMSPLRLLYFNDQGILVMSTIPNMSVEKCSCL